MDPKWSRGKFGNGMASIGLWMIIQFLLSHLFSEKKSPIAQTKQYFLQF